MSYTIVFEKRALQDIRKIKNSGKKDDLAKLNKMLDELSNHPTIGVGNPEPLKYNLTGFWSRRINKKDRLFYQIIEEPDDLVVIVSALGHYE